MSFSLKNVCGIMVFAFSLMSFASPINAEEPAAAASPEALFAAIAEAGKPGPEHKKLEPLAGKWTYTSKMYMVPGQDPVESSGTAERKWILGGRFLEETIIGTGPDGKTEFEGRGTIGYDKQQKKYTYGWMCSMGTETIQSLGDSDVKGKNFTFETEMFCPLRGKKVKGRDEIEIQSPDRHVLTTYQFDDGKELKVMEIIATRVK